MRKVIAILVVGFFILGAFGVSALNISKIEEKSTVLLDDVLDQSQTVMTENVALPVGQIPIPDNPINFQVAQSFIPSKEILTRVELLIGKNSTATYPYVLAIRGELTGDDLTITSIDPGQVPTEEFGWVEIDFDDIMVNTGQTYYIVSYTENTTDNFYAWGANNDSDSYLFGCAWMSIDDGNTWSNSSAPSNPHSVESVVFQGGQTRFDDSNTWDMCFKTYGRDNSEPGAPDISGPTNGRAGEEYDYTFVAVDPDDDDVYYWILWGDGCPAVEWIGPYDSGEVVTVSHTFENQGDFTISAKAKDVYDAEGDWGYLDIKMPKVKIYYSPLLEKILVRFSNIFPLLGYILSL